MALHSKQVPISSSNTRAARNAHARAKEAVRTYDTSAIRPKRSKAPIVILIVVVLAAIAAAAVVFLGVLEKDEPTLQADQEAIVVVEQGEGAKSVADSLLEAQIIGNTRKFVDLVNQKNAAASIIPGTYLFKGGMSMDDVIDVLVVGPSATAETLPIPEGLTRDAIAKVVESTTNGRVTAKQFLDASADASVYVGDFPFLATAGKNSLEGFLFPKTYSVTAADGAREIVRMMLAQFGSETAGLDMAYPQQEGLDLYGVVKLASIIEKEGKVDNYGTIASVFYNRLSSSRPYLESDATTAYEVGHDPTGEEVHADTPYSTYTHQGLPPTPICNPSLAALQAVCAPEETDYMYFYSYPDGTYAFSKTFDEHQATYR